MAGGDSKRLGIPKFSLELGSVTLVERVVAGLSPFFNRITVVTDRPEMFPPLPVLFVRDLLTGHAKNPLRGIHAGLCACGLPYQFVIACDMPFVNLQLIRYMDQFASRYDVVVPRVESYYQPLHAFYSRGCIEPIRELVAQSGGKVTSFYRSVAVRHVESEEINRYDPAGRSFFNINNRTDYEEAKRLLNMAESKA